MGNSGHKPLVTLEDVLLFFLRRWRVFLVVFAAFLAIGIVYFFAGPKHYRVRGTYSLVSSNPSSSSLDLRGASFLGVRTGASEEVRSIRAYLDSREIYRGVIQHLDLLPLLYPEKYDEKNGRWQTTEPSLDGGVGRVKDKLGVQVDEILGLVWLEFKWRDPEDAKRILDGYVAEINRAAREDAIAQYEANAAGIEGEMSATAETEIFASLAEARAIMLQRLAFAKSSPEYLLRAVDPPRVPIAPDRFPIWFVAIVAGVIGVLLVAYAMAAGGYWRHRLLPRIREDDR